MPGGERCKGVPVRGSDLCAAHHPDYRERRRTGARRGGKARGAGELAGIKGEIRTVIVGVLNGEVPTGRAAVAIQGYNTLLRAVEVERRVRELDELEERLEALESRVRGHAG
jgi:hypothetical protein